MAEAPEFLNDFQPGPKPAPGQSRQERLKAAGITEGQSLADFQAEQRRQAEQRLGFQEDSGAEFQRVQSKQGRGNVEMSTDPKADAAARTEQARQGLKPMHPESGLPMEPPTETSVVGHSPEKKKAIAKAKKSARKKKGT